MLKPAKQPFLSQLDEMLLRGIKLDEQDSHKFLDDLINQQWRKGNVKVALAEKISKIDYSSLVKQGYYKGVFGYTNAVKDNEAYLARKLVKTKSWREFKTQSNYSYQAHRYAMMHNMPDAYVFMEPRAGIYNSVKFAALADDNLETAFAANQKQIMAQMFSDKTGLYEWYDNVIDAAVVNINKPIAVKCLNEQLHSTFGYKQGSKQYQQAEYRLSHLNQELNAVIRSNKAQTIGHLQIVRD